MKQVIAHIDMDCFFAACEEKLDSSLKGKPLVIGSPPGTRGVVSTANYEARKYGIHSAMPTTQAAKLCPNVIFHPSTKGLYKKESNAVMEILRSFATEFKQVGIDEAYADITDFAKHQTSLKETARLIKKEVLRKTRLTCSIGISESRYVSKIASDFHKPVGTTIVRNQKEFLKNLAIGKIPGIGKKSQKIMNKLNIETIGDFAKADKFLLLDYFGKHIIHYQNIAKGEDRTGVGIDSYSQSKSISKETTFLTDIQAKKCTEYIESIANKVHTSLHNYGYKTISIKIKYSDFTTITRDFSLKTTMRNKEEIMKKSKELLEKIPDNKKVRLFGIKLSNLMDNFAEQTNISTFI